MDWDSLFGVHVSPLELVIRGTSIYWFLILVFRFVLRRDIGALGVADILLLVIVADASQNAMAGEYKTISEGLILVTTIVVWNLAIDRMAFRFPWFERFTRPRSIELVHDGRILRKHLAREHMTDDELFAKLRQHGVATLSDVRSARLESDGKISVVSKQPESGSEDDDDLLQGH